MFQTLKSNISIHFLSSQFTTSTTITWFHPKWISPADLSVASKIMQPHKQWWLYLTDLWSRCELSWCWVRTFPICCVWRNHRKTPVFRLLLAGDFAIKAGESDGKGLYGTQRIPVVQSEGVVCYSPKLHHNVVLWNVAQKGHAMTYSLSKHTDTNITYK